MIQKKSDFDEFMKLAFAFRDKGMARFSFALFTEVQFAPGKASPQVAGAKDRAVAKDRAGAKDKTGAKAGRR